MKNSGNNPSGLSPAKEKADIKLFTLCKIYAEGKATAAMYVEYEKDKPLVEKALRDCVEVYARFNLPLFRVLLKNAGISPNLVEEYCRRVSFMDETYESGRK